MARIALFPTCVLDLTAPGVGFAVARVLAANGDGVEVPEGVTCCGQPAWNSGFTAEAAKVAATTLDALTASPADVVVVPAGSCATMVRLYWPQLFALVGDDAASARATALAPRVRELSEHLGRTVPDRATAATTAATPTADPTATPATTSPGPTVAYHHSCHMLRELHVHDRPLALLTGAGCTVADWPDGERCCGFGGAFSVKLPETSVAMADEKLASLPADAEVLVGSDLSCLLHLRGRAERTGRTLPVRHLAEVLADRLSDVVT